MDIWIIFAQEYSFFYDHLKFYLISSANFLNSFFIFLNKLTHCSLTKFSKEEFIDDSEIHIVISCRQEVKETFPEEFSPFLFESFQQIF